MDTPRIGLRFRDPALGIDTVQEHRRVLEQEGAVLWGWWKKAFEADHTFLLKTIGGGPGRVLLVDRATRRGFVGNYVTSFVSGSESADPQKIPAYYRDKVQLVAAWFLLTSLEDADYPDDIDRLFGESTFLDLKNLPASSGDITGSIKTADRSAVLHLSDLHFGADYDFLPLRQTPQIGVNKRHLTTCLTEDLSRIEMRDNIAAILVTGDFTTCGDWSDPTRRLILDEFESLRESLGVTKDRIIALPGNHDVVRYPASTVDPASIAIANQTEYRHENDFRLFSEKLTGRRWDNPINHNVVLSLPDADVVLCALNSCTIAPTKWTEYGYVGTLGLDAMPIG